MDTTTSDEIFAQFKKYNIKLPKELRQSITKIVYDALVASYAAGKRVGAGACDCGQMSCPECHG